MEKDQEALLNTRDGMTKLMAKGTTELWRLKQRMECLLKGFENKICAACGEENKSRAKREEEARSRDRSEEAARRRPLANREDPRSPDVERAGRHSREATPATVGCAGCWAPRYPAGTRSMSVSSTASASSLSPVPGATGEKGRRPAILTSRDGVSLTEAVGVGTSSEEALMMQQYSKTRMTKPILTGGPTPMCYQLYTEGNVVTWKQVSVPNYSHHVVLLMPVKR